MEVVLRNKPLSLRMDGVTSLTEERGKGIGEGGYETGSDIDPEEVRMLSEGFTRVEVRLKGYTCTILGSPLL